MVIQITGTVVEVQLVAVSPNRAFLSIPLKGIVPQPNFVFIMPPSTDPEAEDE